MASFFAAFFGEVISCIVHAAGNIGAAVEGFLAENEFEFTLDEIEIVSEGQPQLVCRSNTMTPTRSPRPSTCIA